ncbi:glucoamylase [Legionella birminghamensis]|uniref:glucan 1,4-alpha-glucosidase n=1 Tax=Legionella birminghamensis TaxID=28083 RepID=A0A378I8A2_9GAMM|nr:glycoside hydrolase family 15 protein [Legionella birminghamensis]KTC68932.1 glucoamylase [Legionella birminghamensis]STX31448.1 glucoamylase [Legionella birminghamensis]
MKRILLIVGFITFVSNAVASVFTPDEINALKNNFAANITQEGAIMASPSRSNPNYYYDWARDSAISMNLIASWYEQSRDQASKQRLLSYVSWVERLQHQNDPLPGQDILGEPKFYMPDSPLAAQPYTGPWGRPQNDGPAIRAMTLIRFANSLLVDGESAYVREHLYSQGLNPDDMGTIKMDLEYTAHHWQDKNFDLWEEVLGDHFFTAMVQRKALLEGSVFARQLDDPLAAQYYSEQARLIEKRLYKHIDCQNNIIQATLPPHDGPQKTSELDSAVILGVLLGNTHDDVFSPRAASVKHTVKALREQFKSLYPINEQYENALLFGRYPGDTYDGYVNNGQGNPWFILTATIAEYYYTLAQEELAHKHNRDIVEHYIQTGDAYLRLVKDYAPDMLMSEQINLVTGAQQGAYSLTWSYVAVLRAIQAREALDN